MSTIKKTDWPSGTDGQWLSDFFETDRFLDNAWFKNQLLPAINVKESEKDFTIEIAAPGYKKSDFKIETADGILTISAETKTEKEEKEEDYTRHEFRVARFSRSFTLPPTANDETLQATYENGILKMVMAKKVIEPVKGKRAIEIK